MRTTLSSGEKKRKIGTKGFTGLHPPVNSFSLGQNAFSNEKDAFYTNAQNPDLSVCESGFPVVDHACIGGFSLLHSLISPP